MFQNDLVAMKYIVLNVKHNFQHKKVVNFFNFLYFVSKCLLLMIQNIPIEKKNQNFMHKK